MTDSFPVEHTSEGIGALSYSPARHEPMPDPTGEYADQYNLNDIGLALRVAQSGAC
jgi:hypothetical protein